MVGLSAALTLAAGRREADLVQVAGLKQHFLERLGSRLAINLHGDPARCSPYIVNFAIPGISSTASVSYTHLDVYKRQASGRRSGRTGP